MKSIRQGRWRKTRLHHPENYRPHLDILEARQPVSDTVVGGLVTMSIWGPSVSAGDEAPWMPATDRAGRLAVHVPPPQSQATGQAAADSILWSLKALPTSGDRDRSTPGCPVDVSRTEDRASLVLPGSFRISMGTAAKGS